MSRQPRVSAAAGIKGQTNIIEGDEVHTPSVELRVEYDSGDADLALAQMDEVVAVIRKQIEGAK